MFPTPPSLEAHAQPSPGFSLPDDAPAHLTHHTHLTHASHAAHRLLPGSPPPDAIEVPTRLLLLLLYSATSTSYFEAVAHLRPQLRMAHIARQLVNKFIAYRALYATVRVTKYLFC